MHDLNRWSLYRPQVRRRILRVFEIVARRSSWRRLEPYQTHVHFSTKPRNLRGDLAISDIYHLSHGQISPPSTKLNSQETNFSNRPPIPSPLLSTSIASRVQKNTLFPSKNWIILLENHYWSLSIAPPYNGTMEQALEHRRP